MVTGVGSTTTVPQTQSEVSGVSLAKNFDTFLTLLTTQLKNQDPTSPMDSKEFTNQLVMFSQVEQSINQNKNLEKLLAMFASQQSSNNLSYIGKIVDVDDNQVELQQDGSAFWSYELPAGATSVKYNILDSAGKVVRTVTSNAPAGGFPKGRIELAWDGKDGQSVAQPAGKYKLEVIAKDGGGKTIEGSKVYARGYVSSLDTVDGQQYLVIGGNKYLPEKVVSVYPAPAAPSNDDEEEEQQPAA
ncbi:flagellar hook assembly protein FlgD [Ferrovibrio terrae]|uniref:Basal-body rod modification protein FlgD n=1 Tax=Ferrovibrio terrae TaxID=2594003 RepID=A0A516GYH9_9PROT|nr:flagellar hook capping FlgD N-terminal domain-containing protein [Ferrovibrio terrae]QDO96557.1 flagellar hook assembly protein FlgD [Ferrovibrio terrae]